MEDGEVVLEEIGPLVDRWERQPELAVFLVVPARAESELDRRKRDLLAAFGDDAGGEDWIDAREPRWVIGTPADGRAMVARFEEAGAERIMLQDFLPRDLDMIDLMAEALF